ncbi:MAG TPA: protein-L-isoaspartate O-methyltransferase [Myxococcota bacterium]|nr:protein-L-isoaspartate O-methyltransferase [Myxococcota bacterium]
MNVEQARFNMIEQQIRPWEVLDPAVLELLSQVKRERFVPPEHASLAFADLEVPLGHGEAMMQPKVEARILQELAVQPGESVYEVGTGSGYLAALLARRARHVTSVEIHPDLAARAAQNLRAAGIGNVTLLGGDGALAPLADSTFDVIVLTGSTPVLPQAFLASLAPGGRLFAVVGDAPVMKAVLVRQPLAGSFQHVELFETMLKPLVNAAQPPRFRF